MVLCLFLTALAVTSHLHMPIGKLAATDRVVIIILSLLIDHFRYFVCQDLNIVILPESPLAFYGLTDQTMFPWRLL